MALLTEMTVDGTHISQLGTGSEKRVVVACDDCGKESVIAYSAYLVSQRKREWSKKTFCRKCSNVRSGIAKTGKPIRKSGPRPEVCGEAHHSWKGGKFVASDGYVQVYIGPKSYRKEHFMVMEAAIGRRLKSTEIVHHIDGNKQNNDLDNLVLLESESMHRQAHNSLYDLSRQLIAAGLVRYEASTNIYKAVHKLRELLEQPAEANQQPSREGDLSEGSTTRRETLSRVDNSPTSAGQPGVNLSDDIV